MVKLCEVTVKRRRRFMPEEKRIATVNRKKHEILPIELLCFCNVKLLCVVYGAKAVLTLMSSGQKLAARFLTIYSKEIDMPVTNQEVYTR